jgi:hypothetical protein
MLIPAWCSYVDELLSTSKNRMSMSFIYLGSYLYTFRCLFYYKHIRRGVLTFKK